MYRKLKGLSVEPEMTQMTLQDEHELLLLASDGMWSDENGVGYGFGGWQFQRLESLWGWRWGAVVSGGSRPSGPHQEARSPAAPGPLGRLGVWRPCSWFGRGAPSDHGTHGSRSGGDRIGRAGR